MLFWKPAADLVMLEVNITLSINKTNNTMIDINDDLHRCAAHDVGKCTHAFVYLSVCVCDSRVCFPQMFPLTFDSSVGVKP